MKNTAIITLLLSITLFYCSNKTYSQSQIKGTLTYYFNKFQGNKPDVGSDIFVVDTSKVHGFDYKIHYAFNTASTYRHIYNNYSFIFSTSKEQVEKYKKKKRFKKLYDQNFLQMEKAKKSMNEANNELVKVNSETEDKFNKLDAKNANNNLKITLLNEHTLKTIADGVGNFNLDVKPGVYFVIIKSKGKTGLSISESLGLTYYKIVTVANNQKVNISNNFK